MSVANYLNSNTYMEFYRGLNGVANAGVLDSKGRLIVVGNFLESQPSYLRDFSSTNKILNYVAMFENNDVFPIGNGFNAEVLTVAVDENDNIFVGGKFTSSKDGSIPLKYIAMWDGTSWKQVGEGFNGIVRTLEISSDGTLIAGGDFTKTGDLSTSLNYVAKLNDNEWENIGTGSNLPVYRVKFHNTKLYACGSFSKINNVSVPGMAVWNNSLWESIGHGFSSNILAFDFDDEDTLFVGGNFIESYDKTKKFNYISKYDGTSWLPLKNGLSGSVVDLKYVSDKKLLYVIGYFINDVDDNKINFNYLATWDKIRWLPDNNYATLAGYVTPTTFSIDRNGEFYVPCSFSHGSTLNGPIYDSTINSNGEWIVCGSFTHNNASIGGGVGGGQRRYNNVARWSFDTKQWYSYGSGVNGSVYAVALSSTGQLFIAGDFTETNSGIYTRTNDSVVTLNRIGMWDGEKWNSLGQGFNAPVLSLAFDNKTNTLYAGGEFTSLVGDTPNSMKRLARWNGQNWSEVGGGIEEGNPATRVTAIKIDKFGNVVVGGWIFKPLPNILYDGYDILRAWNGTSWIQFRKSNGRAGFWQSGPVGAIDFDAMGNMYVSGGFYWGEYNYVFKMNVTDKNWTNSTMDSLDGGLNYRCKAIKATKDGVYVSGEFTSSIKNGYGAVYDMNRIARYNGNKWEGISENELTGYVSHINTNLAGDLLITGNFYDKNRIKHIFNIAMLMAKSSTTLSNFPSLIKYANSNPFAIRQPTSNRPGTFTYSISDNSVASISGNIVTIKSVGTATITATQLGTNDYGAGIITATLTVNKINPTITTISLSSKLSTDPPFPLNANTNSNGTISYSSSNPTIASISPSGLVTINGIGKVTLYINVSSTSLYNSRSISRQLTIYDPTSVNPSNVTTGNALATLLSTGTSNTPSSSGNIQPLAITANIKLLAGSTGTSSLKSTVSSKALVSPSTSSGIKKQVKLSSSKPIG